MELLHERCAGLDIGKKDLKACVRTPSPSGKRSRRQEIRTFATTTNALGQARVTLVALEHPGSFRLWLYADKLGRSAVVSVPVTVRRR